MVPNPVTDAGYLNNTLGPYFAWLSDGLYRPSFQGRAGSTVTIAVTDFTDAYGLLVACHEAVNEKIARGYTDPRTNGWMMVVDMDTMGEHAAVGVTYLAADCVTVETDADCEYAPDNLRVVVVTVGTLRSTATSLILDPLTTAHEIGHTLGFPHSLLDYVGETPDEYGYDNVADMMSLGMWGSRVGTTAPNRYAAGWVSDADGIVTHAIPVTPGIPVTSAAATFPTGTATYALRPVGTEAEYHIANTTVRRTFRTLTRPDTGYIPEMIALRGYQNGVFVSAGLQMPIHGGYDAAAPPGVYLYLNDQSSDVCGPFGMVFGSCPLIGSRR